MSVDDVRGARFRRASCPAVASLLLATGLAGCSGISIAPSCPNQLTVGASGVVAANVINPGQVPNYAWVALPADAGTFEDATLPITRFTASRAGEVTIQLTASDGLFQVQSFCRITITDGNAPPTVPGIAVSLSVNPAAPVVDQPVTVTCQSEGGTAASTFDIQRVDGLDVTIMPLGGSSVLFTPAETGTITVQCIGRADDGSEGNPATLVVTISEPAGGARPPR